MFRFGCGLNQIDKEEPAFEGKVVFFGFTILQILHFNNNMGVSIQAKGGSIEGRGAGQEAMIVGKTETFCGEAYPIIVHFEVLIFIMEYHYSIIC